MASASRVDQATIAFRRVLAEANTGEQARVDALVVLAQRTVYVATWPGQQTARTLTNSHGESALPLFTGLDVLDVTATRFGWRNPDGTLQFRELGAREALRHALARSVHFVVIDLGSEHSVEFAREELEPLVNLQDKRSGTGAFGGGGDPQAALRDAVRRTSTRPPRTPLPASPPLMQSRTPAESQPIPTLRPPLTAKPRSPLPPSAAGAPPPAGAMQRPPSMHAQPAKAASGPRPVQRDELPHSPPANRQREQHAGHAHLQHEALASSEREQNAAAHSQQEPYSPPANLHRDPDAAAAPSQREAFSKQANRQRDLHGGSATSPQRDTFSGHGNPPHDPNALLGELPREAYSPHGDPQREPQAAPAAQPQRETYSPRGELQHEPQAAPAAQPQREAFSPNVGPQRDAYGRPAAQPQREALSPHASLQRNPQGAPAGQPQRDAHSPQGNLQRDPHAAQQQRAAYSSNATLQGAPLANPRRDPPAAQRNPAPPPPAPRLDEPTLAERTGTHPGIEPANLPDPVLHGISTGLRGFPEVEWACVMSDGTEIPLIGVRVDPSFLNRVADITDAIMDVGEKQSLELQVLLLNNQELVKNARKNGKAFYPWKR